METNDSVPTIEFMRQLYGTLLPICEKYYACDDYRITISTDDVYTCEGLQDEKWIVLVKFVIDKETSDVILSKIIANAVEDYFIQVRKQQHTVTLRILD